MYKYALRLISYFMKLPYYKVFLNRTDKKLQTMDEDEWKKCI